MTGIEAVDYVRSIIKDSENPNRRGLFWSNSTITLFLNIAQNCFIHTAVSAKLYSLIDTLIVKSPDFKELDLDTLTDKFFHHVSGLILGSPNKLVQVYTGNEVMAFKYCSHSCLTIYNNIATFRRNGSAITDTNGTMYYYRYPRKINFDSTQLTDFSEDTYKSYICKHASVLLGFKETINQREYKNDKKLRMQMGLIPSGLVHKIGDVDLKLFKG